MNHIGVYLSNAASKDEIIEQIFENKYFNNYFDLSGLTGELYSSAAINRFIDEEIRHDKFVIHTDSNSSLLSMSSGQQRKALLTHIISKKPHYIVLDDVYSSVDRDTQQFILEQLLLIKDSTILIQLFYRKHDVLDFIQTVFSIGNDNQLNQVQSLPQFNISGNSPYRFHQISLPHLFAETNLNIHPLVQLNAVSANYGEKPVLKDINWEIQAGEFWQLRGPIGSGKSTLLSMITGDNAKGYGVDMVLFGRKKGTGETIWDIKKQIGYFTPTMVQRFFHRDSVENMIISGLVDSIGLYVKPTDLQRHIAEAWLQILGPTFKNKSFHSLSFGQQRILLVVRAMVKRPPLLILDEPTVGLDDENTELFLNMITAIAELRKIAIIYVSHRTEPELKPEKIFELIPGEDGSTGIVVLPD